MKVLKPNWTQSEQGQENDSLLFRTLRAEVARLIRDSAHDLLSGNAEAVASLILAQLAHKHGLRAPKGWRYEPR